MINIPRVKLEGFLRRNLGGRYFGIMFRKNDGSLRILNARLGIKPSGNGRKTIGKDTDSYMVVWSTNDQGYRAVNLNTVIRVTMNGNSYLPCR
jgi:hypothetical protein